MTNNTAVLGSIQNSETTGNFRQHPETVPANGGTAYVYINSGYFLFTGYRKVAPERVR